MYDNWCGKILYLKQIIKAKNDFPMCLQWRRPLTYQQSTQHSSYTNFTYYKKKNYRLRSIKIN